MSDRQQVTQKLSGWGNAPSIACGVARPETLTSLRKLLQKHSATLIARGLGRAYGDAALNSELVIDMTRCDKLIAFDEQSGVLSVQAGASLADVLEIIVPKGWVMPVMPGTKHVTLGGMVACDVHGKNHLKHGTIGKHVTQLMLRQTDGVAQQCSATQNAELFYATIGGMGLTGIIEQVTVQLMAVSSENMICESKKINNISDMIDKFNESRENYEYRVGWIDHMASGEALGQGVFTRANHAVNDRGVDTSKLIDYVTQRATLMIPFFAPSWLLNKWSIGLYNRWRFKGVSADEWCIEGEKKIDEFFFPLDGIERWNRLYGKRGLLQYQVLIAESEQMHQQIRRVLEIVQEGKQASFLVVMKQHGPAGDGYLSFPQSGYSLALDFPHTARSEAMIHTLNAYALEIGATVYLAKDSLLSASVFEAMYGKKLAKFKAVLAGAEVKTGCMSSLMAERLQLCSKEIC